MSESTSSRNTSPEAPLLAIVGPTASGKSQLALQAAQRWSGEIVNCDSMQLIREMEIGTAKPGPAERSLVPHHLYDRIGPDEFFSAGAYMEEARAACRQIAARARLPIVVGGTGLYLRALLEGVFQGPGKSPRLRRRLQRIAGRKGAAFLHRWLGRRDPASARRIQPSDSVRLVRALEVLLMTGRPISELQPRRRPLEGFAVRKVALNPERRLLYGRIDARVEGMFSGGLLEEVQRLLEQGYSPRCKGFEAIGYRQAVAVLNGRMSLAEAISETAQQTRRYAKRQLTWFRREPDLCWIPVPGESPQAFPSLLECLGDDYLELVKALA